MCRVLVNTTKNTSNGLELLDAPHQGGSGSSPVIGLVVDKQRRILETAGLNTCRYGWSYTAVVEAGLQTRLLFSQSA